MGVTGLWKLIEPSGKPVPVETLEGKVLAIDISIWLHQMIKGFQDQKGAALNNAHLLGLFHRLCKLLYYRIKPVFVFDGCVPQLKRDTIIQRQEQKNSFQQEADRLQGLLLQLLAKEEVVQRALGQEATENLIRGPLKQIKASAVSKSGRKDDASDDIFRLPELKKKEVDQESEKEEEDDSSAFLFHNIPPNAHTSFSSGEENNSSLEENNRCWHTYNNNLQGIDVRSQQFLSLPADVRHEILVDIKETRKQSSWGRLDELPSESNEFSSFQMKRLLKRRDVQKSLEETEKEMGGHSLTYSELQNLLSEDGVLEPTIAAKASQAIHSDERTRFLLVKDLKKKCSTIEAAAGEEKEGGNEAKVARMSSIEESRGVEEIQEKNYDKSIFDFDVSALDNRKDKVEIANDVIVVDNDDDDDDDDDDLKLAIARSLEDTGGPQSVDNVKDYEFGGNKLQLNSMQSKTLKDAAKGPARSYMIEYGGMNDSEVADFAIGGGGGYNLSDSEEEKPYRKLAKIMEKVTTTTTTIKNVSESLNDVDDDDDTSVSETVEVGTLSGSDREDSSSETSDWEEVESLDENDDKNGKKTNTNIPLSITITVNPHQVPEKDDIFADIFNGMVATNGKETRDQRTIHKVEEQQSKEEGRKGPVSKDETLSILAKLRGEIDKIKNITLDDVCSSDIGTNFDIEKEYLENVKKSVKSKETPPSSFDLNQKSKLVEKETMKSPSSEIPRNSEKIGTVVNATIEIEERSPPAQTPAREQLIEECGKRLRAEKTPQELVEMAEEVADGLEQLEVERNRQERLGISITQRMMEDCQRLLRLFGIPYIVAPMEAEAQCAFLESIHLTQGTITDDSDIWLFGGHTVYKNFFANNKHVLEFRSERIEKDFHCDRNKLIQLACLVGSDYTIGIHGIGAVTALEILALFSKQKYQPQIQSKVQNPWMGDDVNVTTSSRLEIYEALERFRDWWLSAKDSTCPVGSSARLNLLRKLKNIEIRGIFPNMAVIEAYLFPRIDASEERFSWGSPDLTSIQEFSKQNFGWTIEKTTSVLGPVLKRFHEKRTQTTLMNYLTVPQSCHLTRPFAKMSKRVQWAVKRLSDTSDNTEEEEGEEEKKKSLNTDVQVTKTVKRMEEKEEKKKSLNTEVQVTKTIPTMEEEEKKKKKGLNTHVQGTTTVKRMEDEAEEEKKKKKKCNDVVASVNRNGFHAPSTSNGRNKKIQLNKLRRKGG